MQYNILGKTNINVSRLGFGLAEIMRHDRVRDVPEAATVLNMALDNGINFLDTASCYGDTEELIGSAVSTRRAEYTLATKCCGHSNLNSITDHINNQGDVRDFTEYFWTGEAVENSINTSLERLKTDYLDIVQLHSCNLNVLNKTDVIDSLINAKIAGKTRFIGYSGDNAEAIWATKSGIFDTLQTSYNIVDQNAQNNLFDLAKKQNMGVIIKRPIANAVWRKSSSTWTYGDEYLKRALVLSKEGNLPFEPEDPILFSMGFVLSEPMVHTAIIGTHNPKHLLSNIALIDESLLLKSETIEEVKKRFQQVDEDWPQLM